MKEVNTQVRWRVMRVCLVKSIMGGHFASPAHIMMLSILWLLHKYMLSELYHPESLEKPTKRHAWKARWLASLADTY